MQYPAQFKESSSGVSVTFRDLPEVKAEGDSFRSALSHSFDALSTFADSAVESGTKLPTPSRAQHLTPLGSLRGKTYTCCKEEGLNIMAGTTVKNPTHRSGCAPYKTCRWCQQKFTALGISRHWDRCAAKRAATEDLKTKKS